MKRSVLRISLIVLVLVTAWEYARWTYYNNTLRAEIIVFELEGRPYVYRMLIPFLARQLWKMGVSVETALRMVVTMTALGFLYALEYLFTAFKRR
jgi:hypothetical protein